MNARTMVRRVRGTGQERDPYPMLMLPPERTAAEEPDALTRAYLYALDIADEAEAWEKRWLAAPPVDIIPGSPYVDVAGSVFTAAREYAATSKALIDLVAFRGAEAIAAGQKPAPLSDRATNSLNAANKIMQRVIAKADDLFRVVKEADADRLRAIRANMEGRAEIEGDLWINLFKVDWSTYTPAFERAAKQAREDYAQGVDIIYEKYVIPAAQEVRLTVGDIPWEKIGIGAAIAVGVVATVAGVAVLLR